MSNVAKHTPHTDALDTLGSIIGPNEKRDAIHLAVEPAVAGERLHPGQHVGFLEDRTMGDGDQPVGIVDPFIDGMIEKGQRFWLVVYPRQITSLRHVWTHPAFDEPKDDDATTSDPPMNQVERSKKWIEDFAASIEQTYNRLMNAAGRWADGNELTYDNDEFYKKNWKQFSEFWKHYEIVTGEDASGREDDYFFTCSC